MPCMHAVADPGFAKRGPGRRTMASARSASLNGDLGDLGAEPPAESRDRAPVGGAESFLYIFIQKVAKS